MNKIIISCPSCSVKFYVNHFDIGPGGRFVRCNLCEYEWLAQPEISNLDQAVTSEKKVLINQKSRNNYQYIMVFLILLLMPLVYFAEDLQYFQDIILRDNIVSNGIKIKNINYAIEDSYDQVDNIDSHKKLLSLGIYLENPNDRKFALESIRVIGFDKNKRQIAQITLPFKELLRQHSIFYMEIKLPFYRVPPHYVVFDINRSGNQEKYSYQQKMMLVKIDKNNTKS